MPTIFYLFYFFKTTANRNDMGLESKLNKEINT